MHECSLAYLKIVGVLTIQIYYEHVQIWRHAVKAASESVHVASIVSSIYDLFLAVQMTAPLA